MHADNRKNDIFILVEGPTEKLDDTSITAEAKYPINFTKLGRKFCLSLHYSGSNSFLFANATEMNQFKAKDSDMKPYPLCLGSIFKDFTLDNLKKTTLNGCVYNFSVDSNLIDTNNILHIHK